MKQIFVIAFSIVTVFSQNWVKKINNKYSKAVVAIETDLGVSGSGFNIEKTGLIVTNYHVVEGASSIFVNFSSGKQFRAQYYDFVDQNKDFVLLQIKGRNLPLARMGNSNLLEIGDEVLAIGNPLFQERSVTKGIISQIRVFSEIGKMIQTDTYIGRGSSGGPLFNKKQNVIGITTAGFDNSSLNFAVPIEYIKRAHKLKSQNTRKEIGFDIKYVQRRAAQPSNVNSNTTNDDLDGLAAIFVLYLTYLLVDWTVSLF